MKWRNLFLRYYGSVIDTDIVNQTGPKITRIEILPRTQFIQGFLTLLEDSPAPNT
jgi:hypothetical protein